MRHLLGTFFVTDIYLPLEYRYAKDVYFPRLPRRYCKGYAAGYIAHAPEGTP